MTDEDTVALIQGRILGPQHSDQRGKNPTLTYLGRFESFDLYSLSHAMTLYGVWAYAGNWCRVTEPPPPWVSVANRRALIHLKTKDL